MFGCWHTQPGAGHVSDSWRIPRSSCPGAQLGAGTVNTVDDTNPASSLYHIGVMVV